MNEPTRQDRFEAAVADYYEHLEQGRTTPQFPEMLRRHPDLEAELRAFLDDVRAVRIRMEPLRELVGGEAAAAPLPGLIEPFELVGEPLGQGGMGVVVRARDRVLGRDVAIKVMRASAQERPDLARRFVEEAQILGQLEHPYVVPLHQLGTLPDGRPFLAMKLVRGRTLAELLRDRPADDRERARFIDRMVDLFGFVSQAVAEAHGRGVLHRDLKPANIMVGAHGEVQVMDWGLAKVRSAPDAGATKEPVHTLREASDTWHSSAGDVLGTYPYMPPEQAAGKVDELDERCDVFGLGAILCEILTGQPPYAGATFAEVSRQAKAAELDDAFARLAACGADVELVQLAKACLAADPAQRPRSGAAVAAAVTAYKNGVQEKLRQAERERAAAEARARAEAETRRVAEDKAAAERRARRVTVVLAVLAVLVVGGGTAAWLGYTAERDARQAEGARQAGEREAKVREALARVAALYPHPRRWSEARADLAGARALTQGDAALLDRVAEKEAELDRLAELEQAKLHAAQIKETNLDYPGASRAFTAAFRKVGLEVQKGDADETARRIAASPLREHLIQALDFWAVVVESANAADPAAKRFLGIAQAADPSGGRKAIRACVLSGDRAGLERLAAAPGTADHPASTLFLLSRVLHRHGATEAAVQVLRRAQWRNREDFWLSLQLGVFLVQSAPTQRAKQEAVEFFRAALAARPRNAVALGLLGDTFGASNRHREAEDALREAVAADPHHALARALLAIHLSHLGRPGEAVPEARRAVADSPGLPLAHLALGTALYMQKRPDEGVRAIHKAIELREDFAEAHAVLALIRAEQGKADEAEKSACEACARNPASAMAHLSLATVLALRGEGAKALAACRTALELRPGFAPAQMFLSFIRLQQGDAAGAEKAARETVALNAEWSGGHMLLGAALTVQGKLDEAVAAFRRARACPGNGEFYGVIALSYLGRVLAMQNQSAEGLKACAEAVRLAPTYSEAYLNRGWVHFYRQEFGAARKDFEKAVELPPFTTEALVGLAMARMSSSHFTKAIEACEKAVKYNPKCAPAYLVWGLALVLKGEPANGLPLVRKAMALSPEPEAGAVRTAMQSSLVFVGGLAVLATASLKEGNAEEACAYLKRVQALVGEKHMLRPMLAKAVRLIALLARLKDDPALKFDGDLAKMSAAEWLDFANQSCTYHYLIAAMRFFDEAFRREPALARKAYHSTEKLFGGTPTNGFVRAATAAMIGSGRGHGSARLTDAERTRYRRLGLAGFRAEIAVLEKRLGENAKKADPGLDAALGFWRRATAAWRRDNTALIVLPEAERPDWQRFWDDVDALLRRAAPPPAPN